MTTHLLEEGGTRFACTPHQASKETMHGVFVQVCRRARGSSTATQAASAIER